MKEQSKDEPTQKPAEPDRTVQKAKERWEGEGGSAPGKINQDHPVPDPLPDAARLLTP